MLSVGGSIQTSPISSFVPGGGGGMPNENHVDPAITLHRADRPVEFHHHVEPHPHPSPIRLPSSSPQFLRRTAAALPMVLSSSCPFHYCPLHDIDERDRLPQPGDVGNARNTIPSSAQAPIHEGPAAQYFFGRTGVKKKHCALRPPNSCNTMDEFAVFYMMATQGMFASCLRTPHADPGPQLPQLRP